MNSFSIKQEQIDPNTTSISLIGDLNSEAGQLLSEQVRLIRQRGYKNLELEFSPLNSIDGTGLKHLIILITQANRLGAAISARGISDEIKSLFELTYLNELVTYI